MILYVNGDSHTAGAEAVVPAAFAEDTGYPELGRQPHPENLKASWGHVLANDLGAKFVCDAESAASNYRILRTARNWIQQVPPWESVLVVIQWSTWEREEWLHNGEYLQVGSSGLDWVPKELEQRYKEFVISVDWNQCQQYWHDQIWQFHKDLDRCRIPHLFFNGNSTFNRIQNRQDWGSSYLDPYGQNQLTYDQILRGSGFATVSPDSWHFGSEAHRHWAEFVLNYCLEFDLLDPNEISTN